MVTTPVRGSQLWADYLNRTVNEHANTLGLDAIELARHIRVDGTAVWWERLGPVARPFVIRCLEAALGAGNQVVAQMVISPLARYAAEELDTSGSHVQVGEDGKLVVYDIFTQGEPCVVNSGRRSSGTCPDFKGQNPRHCQSGMCVHVLLVAVMQACGHGGNTPSEVRLGSVVRRIRRHKP